MREKKNTKKSERIMMREVKFKVWDKDKKIMHQPNEIAKIHFIHGIPYCVVLWSGKTLLRNFILLDFIGLPDKNDKEIYKGDILIPAPNEWEEPPYTVEFDEGCFTINRPHTLVKTFWETDNQFEVIGNICENLELLKNR